MNENDIAEQSYLNGFKAGREAEKYTRISCGKCEYFLAETKRCVFHHLATDKDGFCQWGKAKK